MSSGNPVSGFPRRGNLKVPVFNSLYEKRLWMLEHMAGALRIFGRNGYNEGSAGHITIVDPVDPTSYWINPSGVHVSMITVRDLDHVNADGEAIGGSKAPFSMPGFKIHYQMHKARPEISSICHAHTFYARTFSVFGKKLGMMSQDSCLVYENHVVMDDYTNIGFDEVEGDKVSSVLGDEMAIILQNHGAMTVGKTVDETGYLLILLDFTCKAQLLADAVAANNDAVEQIIPDKVAKSAFDSISGPSSLYAALQPDYELEVFLSKGDFLQY
ncbi:LAQU0S01e13740g1_1 [Lachancea quebecensis]|uniref:LAQU0S01e13740g1_1 n=1 Tax=Lachancea quebecensis TaxID=1654605 RepID=A0A0P1KML3_9SACH|nr:LAQU0S01e13740g1_1 [Lachancea quebecensis]